MIPLVMILLAGTVAPPEKPKAILSRDDYPLEAMQRGEEGQAVADLLINPSGAVETCSIALSSGFQVLDQATCRVLQTRARFIPAKDDDGKPMYAVFRSPPITWSLGSFRGFPVGPDYDLTINRAPTGVSLPVEFEVDYRVTQDGKPQNCAASGHKSVPNELVALACQTIVSAPAQIIRDHNGLPVTALRQASFRFSVDKAHSK